MNSFSEYMDRVKAEEELKTKTKAFIRTASNTEGQEKNVDFGLEFKKGKFTHNRFLLAVSAVAACLVLALGGNAYYHTPINYLCLDINPSVELGINAFGRVVSTQAYNKDGLKLLEENSYSNLSVEDAVSTLVLDAARQGFVAEDGSTVIAVTAESNENKAAVELQNNGESGANSTLSENGISAIVYSDYTDLQLRKQAHDLEISPGKLRLILILQTFDSSITIEKYKNAKMTDIITKADELLTQSDSGWKNGNEAEMLEKIYNAAQQVQAAYANAEREQNRNGPQNQNQGSGEQEQSRNQNQGSNDNGTQNQVQNQGLETKHVQNRSSDTRQQQAQNPEEQSQSQVQGANTSVSNQDQGQTTGAQSGSHETAQEDGYGAKSASAAADTRPDAGGNQTSSDSADTGSDAGGKQISSDSAATGQDAGGNQISSDSAATGSDAGGSQTSSGSADTGSDAGGKQTSSDSADIGTISGSGSSSGVPSENGKGGR